MTDRELDELGTSLLALDKQITRRTATPPARPQPQTDEPAASEWTPAQMKRLDAALGG